MVGALFGLSIEALFGAQELKNCVGSEKNDHHCRKYNHQILDLSKKMHMLSCANHTRLHFKWWEPLNKCKLQSIHNDIIELSKQVRNNKQKMNANIEILLYLFCTC